MGERRPENAVLAAIRTADAIDGEKLPVRICKACVQSMPVEGAALSLVAADSRVERVGSSDDDTARIEELQVTLGEGPVLDAIARNAPVLVHDLRGVGRHRWPLLAEAVEETNVRSASVFPVHFGAVRLGALSFYGRATGHLTSSALTAALRISDIVALLFLGRGGDLSEHFNEDWLDQSSWSREVHQATGMLVAQLGVGVEEAFLRLRAYAFAEGIPLSRVARDVISRRLRLGDST